MKENLINYDTAVLAKMLGFQEPTLSYYVVIKSPTSWRRHEETIKTVKLRSKVKDDDLINHNHSQFNRFAAPTQGLLQKWLRVNYNLEVVVMPHKFTDYSYTVFANSVTQDAEKLCQRFHFEDYKEALEHGLQKALYLIEEDL